MEAWVAIPVGLMSGIVGAVVGPWIQFLFTRRREADGDRSRLVGGYLWQMQDAAETLYFRLHNLSKRGGGSVMPYSYYENSTLFALGTLLAQKRRLGSAGIYALVDAVDAGVGDPLRRALERVEAELGRNAETDGHFYRYERLLLAEALLADSKGSLRLVGYREFLERLEDDDFQLSLEPARGYVRGLDLARLTPLLDATERVGRSLENLTGLTWAAHAK